jgi:trans-aconitate methyltransferase
VAKLKLIYQSPLLYRFVMRLLYGRYYRARNRALADLIPPNCSVVDLCCGPGLLYEQYLRKKNVHYTGIDSSPAFVAKVKQLGASATVVELRSSTLPLPRAEFLIMQSSLYYFLPDPSPLVDRMLAAAAKGVIIAEPVKSLATSSLPLIRKIAVRLSGPGGEQPQRYTEETLDQFFAKYRAQLQSTLNIPGGREKIYMLRAVT